VWNWLMEIGPRLKGRARGLYVLCQTIITRHYAISPRACVRNGEKAFRSQFDGPRPSRNERQRRSCTIPENEPMLAINNSAK